MVMSSLLSEKPTLMDLNYSVQPGVQCLLRRLLKTSAGHREHPNLNLSPRGVKMCVQDYGSSLWVLVVLFRSRITVCEPISFGLYKPIDWDDGAQPLVTYLVVHVGD